MTTTRKAIKVSITCEDCLQEFRSLPAFDSHSCFDDEPITSGGRCEDYPCCGHTDGPSCAPQAEATMAYWLENPHLLDEEYYDYE